MLGNAAEKPHEWLCSPATLPGEEEECEAEDRAGRPANRAATRHDLRLLFCG